MMREWVNYLPAALFMGCALFPFSGSLISAERIEIYVFILFALYRLVFLMLNGGRRLKRVNIVGLSSTLLAVYLSGRSFAAPVPLVEACLPLGFLCLYYGFAAEDSKENRRFAGLIVVFSVAQALYGFLQYTVYSSGWVAGNLSNPAGYAASLVVGLPFCLTWEVPDRQGKVLKTVCSTLVLSAICLSGSRAGIISGGFILGVFLWKTVAMSAKWRRVIGSTSIIMGAVVGCILFSWKQDSAMGRILIWKISGGMVVEAPVWGRGAGSFQADYMTCQADFFKANPDSKYAQVAGNVFHPFNEFLLLSIEFGLVGLLLVSLILFPVVRNICISGFNPFSTCIAAIALFSCFSYPVHYAYVCIVLAFCLGNVQLKPLFWLKIRRIGLFVLGGLSAMILFFCLAKDVEYEYQWNRIREGTLSGKAPELMEQYRLLYQKWNYNPRFLYHYGVTLNYIGLHRASNDILAQCSEVYNSYDLQMLMGNNYYAEGKWDLALSHYAKASQMCPNRFRPLYMQIMVYDHRQEYDSAAQLARELLVKPVKIPSDEIRQMQSEARRYTRNLNRD
ncbi:O-antigen ligase family protein [Rikenella microfusus]|uniref:Lipid A core - O-antigen ligase and related enzymes n=1 Tax=Rikenella microfusus TaxID=28139 RepID=A0A379MPS7_9BACT|nr:O-antigen ligase family protein [Rikenella microfusus]SUE33513.1 Lipid A core - O-antigen ligase and related enzymes [Rikenella microfusus]